MNMRSPTPTPRGRPRGPVLPDVLTRCLLRRSGRLNHAPGLGSTARSIIGERIEKTPLLAGFLSGRRDSNSGPPVPQTGALTRLRHAPRRIHGTNLFGAEGRSPPLGPRISRSGSDRSADCPTVHVRVVEQVMVFHEDRPAPPPIRRAVDDLGVAA